MQAQALGSRMNMNRAIPVHRLITDISDKAQVQTQQYGGRPFGVGLLIAGCDVKVYYFRAYNLTDLVFLLGDWYPFIRVFSFWYLQ